MSSPWLNNLKFFTRFGHIPLWWFRPLSVVVLATSEVCWALLRAPPTAATRANYGHVAWAAHVLGAAIGIPLSFVVFDGEWSMYCLSSVADYPLGVHINHKILPEQTLGNPILRIKCFYRQFDRSPLPMDTCERVANGWGFLRGEEKGRKEGRTERRSTYPTSTSHQFKIMPWAIKWSCVSKSHN